MSEQLPELLTFSLQKIGFLLTSYLILNKNWFYDRTWWEIPDAIIGIHKVNELWKYFEKHTIFHLKIDFFIDFQIKFIKYFMNLKYDKLSQIH